MGRPKGFRQGPNYRAVVWSMAEKQEQSAGDRMMELLGFASIHFSQPRNSMQTPGISDRLYLHTSRPLAVWWEVKREGGKQTPAQVAFQKLVEGVGWSYVAGPCSALETWCISRGLARRAPLGNLIGLRG